MLSAAFAPSDSPPCWLSLDSLGQSTLIDIYTFRCPAAVRSCARNSAEDADSRSALKRVILLITQTVAVRCPARVLLKTLTASLSLSAPRQELVSVDGLLWLSCSPAEFSHT